MTVLEYLDRIEKTLTIPAAEYVPAIGDVFSIIDEARRASRAGAAVPPDLLEAALAILADYDRIWRVRRKTVEALRAALAATGPTPTGYVLIGKDALRVLFNALERDAAAGHTVRGEMVVAARESVELGAQRLALSAATGSPASGNR